MSKSERIAQLVEVTRLGKLIRALGGWNGILVLGYHRVGLATGANPAGVWDASPDLFEGQLQFLDQEFDVVAPGDLEAVVRARRGRYVLLTFDDGYRDTFDYAFPILKRHGLPATFFLTTGFIDDGRIAWWDEISWMVEASPRSELRVPDWFDDALSLVGDERTRTATTLINLHKRLSREHADAFVDAVADATATGRHPDQSRDHWMTWDQVRELRSAGMYIGGHSVSHPLLARLPRDEQEREIVGCKLRLETELGERMRYFSYPYGGINSFNDDTRQLLAAHGVELAFSFYGGYQRFDDWDAYDVRRRGLGLTMSPRRFALVLTLPQMFARHREPRNRRPSSPGATKRSRALPK